MSSREFLNQLSAIVGAEHGHHDDFHLTARQQILVEVFKVAKMVRSISVFQFALVVVFGLYSRFFFILLPFPICGYIGARYYIYKCMYIYCVYVVLDVIGSVVSLVLMRETTFFALRLIYVLVDLVIARYATKMASFLLAMQPEDFEFLQNHPAIAALNAGSLC